MSLVEAVADASVGFWVAVLTQMLVFSLFGVHATLAPNIRMGVIIAVSFVRSHALRRLFNAFASGRTLRHNRSHGEATATIRDARLPEDDGEAVNEELERRNLRTPSELMSGQGTNPARTPVATSKKPSRPASR